MINVSLDVSAVPQFPVGAGRYTAELTAALSQRHDVGLVLWSRQDDAGRWEKMLSAGSADGTAPRQVQARAPRARLSRIVWEQTGLARLVGREPVDVHHGPHYTMPERAKIPMVVTIHDLTFFDHPEWHERTKVRFFRRAIRRAAVHADALVCVSEQTSRRLQDLLSVAGRIFVVPHGVDHARFHPAMRQGDGFDVADEELRRRLGVAGRYVLFLGTLEPRKAVPDLVRAFAALSSRERDLQLVLAGSPGWGADEVARAIAETATADRVLVTGYVDDVAVPALLRGAAVVAYPAREEGFGLPALEALACGAPLVTTEATAMAEVAGDAALLVPAGRADLLAQALEAALTGGPQADGRRRRGVDIARRHTWDLSADGHLAAYRWAVEHTGAGHRRALGGPRRARPAR